jgi:hypothetical protein
MAMAVENLRRRKKIEGNEDDGRDPPSPAPPAR